MINPRTKNLFCSPAKSEQYAIEAVLHSESLRNLKNLIHTDTNFMQDLNTLYKNIRFSIDVESCMLLWSENGLYWESMLIVHKYRFIAPSRWEKITHQHSRQSSSPFDQHQGQAVTTDEKLDNLSVLEHLLIQENTHVERFASERGGVIYKPLNNNAYSQHDKAYLKNVSAIVASCIDKEHNGTGVKRSDE